MSVSAPLPHPASAASLVAEDMRPTPMDLRITQADIHALVREPSAEMRMRITSKMAQGFHSGTYTDSEVHLATEIFRLLLKDTDRRVRQCLAKELAHSHSAPHDVIWALANDVSDVALPVLHYSQLLSEEELITLVQTTREQAKWMAIAQRETLSKPLSHALISTCDYEVTRLVVRNEGAALADTTVAFVMEEFAKDNSVLSELVYRGGLPNALAEKLFSVVSEGLKKQLTQKYRLSKTVAEGASERARETATLQFVSSWMSQQDIQQLVEQMHRNKRLTDSVIIRSLCIGDLRFFETAIAQRVGVPVSNARILLMDPGPLGFKAIYESACLPTELYEAIRTLVQLAQQETEYGYYRTADYAAHMIERVEAGGYLETVPHMEVLLTLIGRAIPQVPLH